MHEAGARSQAGPLRPNHWQQAPGADCYHALAGSKITAPEAWRHSALDSDHHTQVAETPDLLQRFKHLVACRLQLYPVPCSTDPCAHINTHLQKTWLDLTHTAMIQPHTPAKVGADLSREASIKQLWHLTRLKQQLPTTTFVQKSRAIQLQLQIRSIQNTLHKRGKQRKQEHVDRILQEAESSTSQAALYHASRQLAPKTRHSRIQLRDSQGMIMSPQGELRAITDHFRTIYGDRPSQIRLPLPDRGLDFTPEEVTHALCRLLRGKALPPAFAPACLGRPLLATGPLISTSLGQCLRPQNYRLYEDWCRVHVCLIPKVSLARLPKQLRPICLLPPGSKILAMMPADRIRDRAEAFIKQTPQFAYVSGRGTDDAISRVCGHLHEARTLAAQAMPNIHQLKAGTVPSMIAGGLSLSLDIDKALDSLPRDQIVPSTQEAGLEPEEIALALHIHLQAKLCFSIAHQETELHFRKAFGKAVASLRSFGLLPLLGFTWSISRPPKTAENPLYADDVWASWTIKTQEQFRSSLRAAGTLIHILQEAGLRASLCHQNRCVALPPRNCHSQYAQA